MPNKQSKMSIDFRGVDVPRLDQYFGTWAIDPTHGKAMFDQACQRNWADHVSQDANIALSTARNASRELDIRKSSNNTNIAQVYAMGTLMKQATSLQQSSSTIRIKQEIRAAVNDSSVDAILLIIDSPGGTVAGTEDLANAIIKARESKPVVAFIEDLGASAAYWIASATDAIYANTNTAMIGSIGTYMALADSSERFSAEGIKIKVYSTGAVKGAGTPGTQITAEHDAYFQATVDSLQKHFGAAVQTSRGLSDEQLAQVCTGGIFTAQEAIAKKLIDGIQSFDQTIEATAQLVASRNNNTRQQEKSTMPTETPSTQSTTTEFVAASIESTAASFGEIKSACIGADSQFICDQLEAKATVDQAKNNWMKQQNDRLQKSEAGKQNAEEKLSAQTNKPGCDPLGDDATPGSKQGGGDARERWNAAIDEKVKANTGMERHLAAQAVAREEPALRQALV
ncbi:MAG: S49 family peptidase [Phycisphaeraceae bacterium]|nr:S49 family peptidase [Phycisphaeraceae bacterium]